MQAHYEYSNLVKEWLTKHETRTANSDQWGNTEVPVMFLVSPDADVAARQLSESHVLDVVDSLRKFGIQVHRVKVLIWKHDLPPEWAANPNLIDLTRYDANGKAPFKMQVIAGDHTIAAVKKLMALRPLNSLWRTFWVRIIVAEDNAESRTFAQALGSLDNKVAEVSKGATPWDNLNQIHTKRVSIWADQTLDQAGKKKAWGDYKQICKTTMIGGSSGKATATIGSYFAIAKMVGPVWDNVATIFKKDANGTLQKSGSKRTKSGNSKPLAHGPFCHMANIPDKQLLKWTQKVIDGQWSPADFKNSCMDVKKVYKLHTFIKNHLNHKFRHDFDDFGDAAKRYKFLQDVSYIAKLKNAFNVKRNDTNLPQTIANSIEQKIEIQLEEEKNANSTRVLTVLPPFFFFTQKKNIAQEKNIEILHHIPSDSHCCMSLSGNSNIRRIV